VTAPLYVAGRSPVHRTPAWAKLVLLAHGRRREFPNVAFNVVLGALALVLAIGRF